jgi:hypothetical protein
MKRQVRTLICVVAAAMVVVGGMQTGLEFMRHRITISHHRASELNMGRVVIGGVLIVLGIILFAASRSLAEQLTDDFEE